MGGPCAWASPVARVGLALLPDAFDMSRAAEIISVMGLLLPTVLAGSLAGLVARRLGAVALVPDVARVRSKEGLTVFALTFAERTSHKPASPQAHDLQSVAETEENGGEKRGPTNSEENGRRGEICPVEKKMAQSTGPVHPDGLSTVSGYR